MPVLPRRLLLLLAVSGLFAPAILGLLPTAIANEKVPYAQSGDVEWVPQKNVKSVLYLTRSENAPDPGNPQAPAFSYGMSLRAPGSPNPVDETRKDPTGPPVPDPTGGPHYQSYAVAGTGPVGAVPAKARFESAPLTHEVNVTGNNTFALQWSGYWTGCLSWTVAITSTIATDGRSTVAVHSFTDGGSPGDTGPHTLTKAIPLHKDLKNRFMFQKNSRIVVEIEALAGSRYNDCLGGVGGAPVPVPTQVPAPTSPASTWTLAIEDPALPSFLEIRTIDAVKAAVWATDEESQVKRVFRPKVGDEAVNRIEGFFAVWSAFGGQDRPASATITVLKEGRPFPIGKENLSTITLDPDDDNTSAGIGLFAYRIPERLWDFAKSPTGEYAFRGDGQMRTFDAVRQALTASASWNFAITSQTLTVRPYDDRDPRTLPSPLEAQSHDVEPGGSTSFLLLVNNSGSVNDTVTLLADLVSSEPLTGWSAAVKGERVFGNGRVTIYPGREELFVVTVKAPVGTRPGQSAVFSVKAKSGIDDSVESRPITIIATVSHTVRHGAGVLVKNSTEEIRPGQDHEFIVYAWNRGTRAANLSVTIREVPTQYWNSTFVVAGSPTRRAVLPGVPAGDVVPLRLVVNAEVKLPPGASHNLTFNATLTEGFGVGMDRDVNFVLKNLGGFRVQLLEGIRDRIHALEMFCNLNTTPGQPDQGNPTGIVPDAPLGVKDCNDPQRRNLGVNDAPEGTWFRVWVTNTGDIRDRYTLTIEGAGENARSQGDPRSDAFDRAPVLYKRRVDGSVVGASALNLDPGQTGELYVWLAHRTDLYAHQLSRYEFTVRVKSDQTKQEYTVRGTAEGRDSSSQANDVRANGVLLESVRRSDDYVQGGEPIVDISLAKKREVLGYVDIDGTTYFRVRVTNGASWHTFRDESDRTYNSSVHLYFLGGFKAQGWNVSMRPVNGELDVKKNPWKKEFHLDNRNYKISPNRWESFIDHEMEVKVSPPPSNSSTKRVVAGENIQFSLIGEQTSDGGGASRASSTLEFQVFVSQLPSVNLTAARGVEFVQPGKSTAFVVYLNNTGSAPTLVNLTATFTDDSSDRATWSVTPGAANLNLTAHENRSVAIIARAPTSASPGDLGVLKVGIGYRRNPAEAESLIYKEIELRAEVKEQGKLRLTGVPPVFTAQPGGTANFTLTLRSAETDRRVEYRMSATPILNWTQSVSPASGMLDPGQTTSLTFVVIVPKNVLSGRDFHTVIKVEEVGQPEQFDLVPLTVSLVGGRAFPQVLMVKTEGLVERGDTARFLAGIKNIGSVPGDFLLEARAGDPAWAAWVNDSTGRLITKVRVNPNELVNVNLTVRAPRIVKEGATVPVTLSALSPSQFERGEGTVRAKIHDYGLDVEVVPARADLIAGGSSEFTVKVTNLGNGNDTLNLSVDRQGLTEWTTEFSNSRVTLPPGESQSLRLIVRSPKTPLPTPRAYPMTIHAGSLGGAAVGVPKNDSVPLTLNLLDFRAFDADGDGCVELAINLNKRGGDGFEEFREIFTTRSDACPSPKVSEIVDKLSGKGDGKTDFLLDVPEGLSYDGIADVYFDPDLVFTYQILFRPDVTGDATPDYFLDTDNDGVIDHLWDTATKSLMRVTVIRAFGDAKEQFLVDTNGDQKPDKFYDPEAKLVTKVTPEPGVGRDAYGIDTNNDGRPNKYFDTKSGTLTDAKVSNFFDFALQYWYFFGAFALVVVVSAAVISRRRRLRG